MIKKMVQDDMREILDELEIDSDLVKNGREGVEAVEKGSYGSAVMISDAEEPSPLDPGVRRSATVVTLFRKMVPDQLAGLKEAIESGDSTEVKQSAHKLKGGCLALGAKKMGMICASLEPYPDDAQRLFKELEVEHAIVLDALSAELGE